MLQGGIRPQVSRPSEKLAIKIHRPLAFKFKLRLKLIHNSPSRWPLTAALLTSRLAVTQSYSSLARQLAS